ncbi:MAG: hypothetical protein Q8O13_08740 [Candidatus Omnitrophota bacterium]|nr:hypothetical protein [Candidatus Omnitrophota bacterium]
MPIKKSSLEKKWYYRVAKILFLLIPIIVIVFLFLNNRIDISNLPKGNISDILQNDIVYIVGGLILYFIVICAIWRIFLYIAFGGLENDTRKTGVSVIQQSTSPSSQSTPAKAIGPIIAIIFCVAIFAIAFSQTDTNPFKAHTYGATCTNSAGKTGIYGTNGACHTCSGSGIAVTSPVKNCSNGVAGVYCCNSGNNNDGCIATGCDSMWYCSGSYYIGNQEIDVPGLCFPVHPNTVHSSWTGVCRQCP